jgi:hypothetical protein
LGPFIEARRHFLGQAPLLRPEAQSRKLPLEVLEVLFMCVHNAGRSQMAAALLQHHAAGRVLVPSAGSGPAAKVNPAVVAAMAEVGIDISKEVPKPAVAKGRSPGGSVAAEPGPSPYGTIAEVADPAGAQFKAHSPDC